MKFAGRAFGTFVVALVLALSVAIWSYGTSAVARSPKLVREPPRDLPIESFTLESAGDPTLSGWVSDTPGSCAAVLLLHRRGSDKSAMADRARLLHAAGYSVVMMDLSGHGESGGDIRGFGYVEGTDATRALSHMRRRFAGQKIGAIGTSLGAAALMFADPEQAADAYVLEQLYSTLAATTAQRAPFDFGRDLQATVLLAQMPLRLGYGRDAVRPVDRIGLFAQPKLLLAAERDPFVGRDQTEALLAASDPETKLVWFDVAGHVDLERRMPEPYREAVLPFLHRTLCSASAATADGEPLQQQPIHAR